MQRFTNRQKEWLERYQRTTGFDPLGIDDPEKSFIDIARESVRWFVEWSEGCKQEIYNYPGWLAEFL